MISTSIIHFTLVSGLALLAWRQFASRHSLLPFTILGFLAFCSLGLAFAPYLPSGIALQYVLDTSSTPPIICQQDSQLYTQQVLAHWCFLLIPAAALLLNWRGNSARQRPIPEFGDRNPQPTFIVWSLFGAGLLLSAKFYCFGPGLDILASSRLIFDSSAEAVQSRSMGKDMLDLGQGAFMAEFAARVVLPLTAAVISQNAKRQNILLFSCCAFISMTYAFQTRQKLPLVMVTLTYGLLFFIGRAGRRRIASVLGSFLTPVYMMTVVLLLSSTSYLITSAQSVVFSVLSALARMFVVPCMSEANFFYCFPDVFSYRGWSGIFSMGLGLYASGDDVSIYDVAFAVSGSKYSANASLVAVAWSGAGYWGILVLSFLITVGLLVLDRLLANTGIRIKALLLVLSVGSINGMVSGGFADYVASGGLLFPIMFAWLYRFRLPSERHRHVQPPFSTQVSQKA